MREVRFPSRKNIDQGEKNMQVYFSFFSPRMDHSNRKNWGLLLPLLLLLLCPLAHIEGAAAAAAAETRATRTIYEIRFMSLLLVSCSKEDRASRKLYCLTSSHFAVAFKNEMPTRMKNTPKQFGNLEKEKTSLPRDFCFANFLYLFFKENEHRVKRNLNIITLVNKNLVSFE